MFGSKERYVVATEVAIFEIFIVKVFFFEQITNNNEIMRTQSTKAVSLLIPF